ncbi:MAG: L-threonylcarbamoyladenylate synthase [Candidatus Omnitrophica bacterium]|nr:L-threonylcarbamoyladenylate synthase [Candidatus Omnitrophota bacterium]
MLKKTLVLKPDRKNIAYCAKVIKAGGLVAFPTETVYGIAANLSSSEAIRRLYKVKNRPRSKPFTVHITSLATIKKMGCAAGKEVRPVLKRFWPGPLTVILKSKRGKRIGFRMPANKVAIELIRAAAVPVVAPSANLSGRLPPISAKDVLRQLDGKIDVLLDAGRTKVGVESTVLDLTVKPPKILRKGAIKLKANSVKI